MNVRKTLLFFFFFLAGVVLGSLLAGAVAGMPGLSWLAHSSSIGFGPVTVDLSVVTFTLGATMAVNVAQIFTLGAAMLLYAKTAGRG